MMKFSRARKRIVKKKSPKGREIIRIEKVKPKKVVCGICGKEFYPSKNFKRPFNNVLCPSCVKETIKIASRVERGEIKLSDVDAKYKKYVLQVFAH